MSLLRKTLVTLLILMLVAVILLYWFITTREQREYSFVTYQEQCANCHGDELQGTVNGTNLMEGKLQYGDSTDDLIISISKNLDAHSPIEWFENATPVNRKAMALYVSERKQRFPSIKSSYKKAVSEREISSKHYRFKVEVFSELASRPYAIAPMKDGRVIVSEKVRGLSIVNKSGLQGDIIDGAPRAHQQFASVEGSYVGWGQLLDVALHPYSGSNGWIYVSFADRCQLDCGSLVPQSMVKVVRGRIVDNRWTDEELIWSVHKDYYTVVPDGVAAGRLAFDRAGFLYITVGGKAPYKHLHNMDTPYGKIHRVRDDGTVPEDNPYWLPTAERESSSTRHTVWSYGHRTTQGLDNHPLTGDIWSTEMGPRGGDEINKIIGGENYGWPLYTNALDYDSDEVSIGKDLGLDFALEDTVLPVVDFTPAPAISNFTFHKGNRFPDWNDDLLVGSLKAMTLYRVRIKSDGSSEIESLASDLGRIRDVAMGYDGLVYIAIEHDDKGSIVRLVPLKN